MDAPQGKSRPYRVCTRCAIHYPIEQTVAVRLVSYTPVQSRRVCLSCRARWRDELRSLLRQLEAAS